LLRGLSLCLVVNEIAQKSYTQIQLKFVGKIRVGTWPNLKILKF